MHDLGNTSVSDFLGHPEDMVTRVKATREPVILMKGGRSQAVLLDVKSYEQMQKRLAILEGIARGEKDASEGRTAPHGEVMARLKSRWRAKK